MSISVQILQALQNIKTPHSFQKYRDFLKLNKKLKRNDWLTLRELMKTDFIYEVIQLDLTSRENKVVRDCIKSIKLKDTNGVLQAILKKRNYFLLEGILHKNIKNSKFNVSLVEPFLIEMVNLKETKLIHLHLLQTIFKNYPFLIGEEVLDFCRRNPHEICKEIVEEGMEVKRGSNNT